MNRLFTYACFFKKLALYYHYCLWGSDPARIEGIQLHLTPYKNYSLGYWIMIMINCLAKVKEKCYIKIPNARCDIAILVTVVHFGWRWLAILLVLPLEFS